jgi:hypothetical protein
MSRDITPIKAELERIRKANGGVLLPEQVVAAAKRESSPLHSQFEWDDGEAAHQFRISQARALIRVYVTVFSEGGSRESRTYVSLTSDRADGGGYRAMVDVLSNEDLRQQLLADAKADMLAFRSKYAALQELAMVFAAMDAAVARKKLRVKLPAKQKVKTQRKLVSVAQVVGPGLASR